MPKTNKNDYISRPPCCLTLQAVTHTPIPPQIGGANEYIARYCPRDKVNAVLLLLLLFFVVVVVVVVVVLGGITVIDLVPT